MLNDNVMISLCDGISNRFDPLGARCIMGLIEKIGGKFSALLQDRLLSREDILSKISKQNPFAIWVSVQPETLNLLPFMEKLSMQYDGPIIVGNVGARGLLEQELKLLRSNIVVVLGQGEDAVFNLYLALSKDRKMNEGHLKKITNVRFYSRDEMKLIETSNSPSKLAKETIPSELKLSEAIHRGDVITVRSSSGCHFSCVFCTVRDINNKQRWISQHENVLREHLTLIVKNGKKQGTIRFVDDDLAGNIQNLQTISDAFNQVNREFNTRLRFGFATRASHILNEKDTPEQARERLDIWKNAVDAGLESLFLGLESGSSTQLKRLGKSTKAKYNFEAASIAKDFGINLEIGFIPIDPFMKAENWRTEMQDNIRLARYIGIAKTCPTWLAPMRAYEGSPMVRWLKKLGLLRERIGDTDEYFYEYLTQEVSDFIEILGPTFCSGKNNGLYDLKREMKYAQWYPSLVSQRIEGPCDAIVNSELNYVEQLLKIELYGQEVLKVQLDYIDILKEHIDILKTSVLECQKDFASDKILNCCDQALIEIQNWKLKIEYKGTCNEKRVIAI